jgi:thiol-disulfide isomerase/thioredoxin
VFGALTVLAAVAIYFGVEARIQAIVPTQLSAALTTFERQDVVQEELNKLETENNQPASLPPAAAAIEPTSAPEATLATPTTQPTPKPAPPKATMNLPDAGPAPELTGLTEWINSEPLTLAGLRGKVVLVHFWTFGCINCIHVQPYVKAWYERYADAGFVVLGVHTPELSFERDIDNVREAVANASVTFPVAFDPSFGTWQAYGNHYWPAFYFVDKAGRIRHVHFGEGDYEGSEQVIRQLLSEAA